MERPTLTEMYNFYSSGDEVLEIGPRDISVLTGVSDSMRRYTWHKQEAFKGRNVLYGSGWAGWGFESNVTAQAANAASSATLRDAPIFEHDPDEMCSATIATNMQNRILAKGIPVLSSATGIEDQLVTQGQDVETHGSYEMLPIPMRPWCRISYKWQLRWLHTDVHNIAYFFTHHVFGKIVEKGGL